MKNPLLIKLAVICGCLALIGTMVVVVLSVIGRHIKIPLPGSIEIVELLIVVVASISLLYATVIGTHASARLFIDRLEPHIKNVVEKMGLAFGALFILALITGNGWLIFDYWSLHEASHLLGIPIIPFRILLVFSLTVIVFVLIRRFISSGVSNGTLHDD